jgi:hypothetical protein
MDLEIHMTNLLVVIFALAAMFWAWALIKAITK